MADFVIVTDSASDLSKELLDRAGIKTVSLCFTMNETADKAPRQTVFISHGDCLADAEHVADLVKGYFPDAEIYMNTIGPVIGAHTGPDVVALFYKGEPR